MSNEVTTVENNPFGGKALAQPDGHSTVASSSREIAEVQAAMAIAKRFPRDMREAVDRILESCRRPTLAASALYSYNRGGSDVTGPSIRLAEAMANSWGNIQCGIRELEQRNGESTVEAFAWDIETNTRIVKVFQVPHIRHTKAMTKKLTDPRDIYELVANQGARRLRACILGIIPGDVIDAAVKECENTLTAVADTSPEAVSKIVAKFAAYGVTKEQIERRLMVRMEGIKPAQVVHLGKIITSLRDGMSMPADWFEFEDEQKAGEAATKSQELADAARKRREEAAKIKQDRDSPAEILVGGSRPDGHPALTQPNPDFPLATDFDQTTGEVITKGEQA